MADAKNRTALAQEEIEKDTIRELSAQAQRIGDDLTKEQRASKDFRREVAVLNNQLVALFATYPFKCCARGVGDTGCCSRCPNCEPRSCCNEALASESKNLRVTDPSFLDDFASLGKRGGNR